MSDVNYVLGLDLGQSRDPTALAVVELYQCGHLERLPLGTGYTAIVSHVKWVLSQLPRGTELVIDFTGVGRPVFDLFEISGVDPIGVLITGGASEANTGRIYSVPKINLISWVQALLHQEWLKIQRELPEAKALVRELEEFRVDFTQSGHMTFNARSGQHDDLLLAMAIAAWRAKLGEGPPVLNFYRAELELAKQRTQGEALETGGRAESLGSFGRIRAQVRDDARELYELYLDTLSGLRKTNVCASCGRPLGVTRTTDGVSSWHSGCPVPRGIT